VDTVNPPIATPNAPNSRPGNVYANDVWINGVTGGGKWASQISSVPKGTLCGMGSIDASGYGGGWGTLVRCNGVQVHEGACPPGYSNLDIVRAGLKTCVKT
jgi:hypothetical protein